MANAVKYWNGSSWQSSAWFGHPKVWDGSQWRMVEFKYAGGSGSGSWNVPYGSLDAQNVTVGSYSYVDYEFGLYEYQYGFGGYTGGSISDGTSNIYGGAAITDLYYSESGSGTYIYLVITGATNSGWTTMNINGTTYSRSSASFSGGGWTWAVAAGANPFGTSGVKQVLWS